MLLFVIEEMIATELLVFLLLLIFIIIVIIQIDTAV